MALALRPLGFPTIDRWAPLGRARGLGDYTETTTSEGTCGGADFRCSARPEDNGIFSCRPCTTAVLDVFRALQTQLNRLIVAKKLPRDFLLDIDGRIGPDTVAAARAVGAQNNIPPGLEDAARYLAVNAEAAVKELKFAADQAGAPTKPPTIPGGGTSPPVTTIPPSPVQAAPKSKKGIIVGALATMTAIGLVAAAYQYRKG